LAATGAALLAGALAPAVALASSVTLDAWRESAGLAAEAEAAGRAPGAEVFPADAAGFAAAAAGFGGMALLLGWLALLGEPQVLGISGQN
jgi:hypothetical protein